MAISMLFLSSNIYAQKRKCGLDYTIQQLKINHPEVAQLVTNIKEGTQYTTRAEAKTTASVDSPTIPVVFHVVLTQGQLAVIGGEQGVINRINAQMKVLNEDFNALNADSIAIPTGFKKLFGKTGFRFALAQTAPNGTATDGYEIIITEKSGFDIEGGWGSGFGFSSAKYTQGGGSPAWDVNSYLNIWIINPLDFGSASDVLGLAIPAYLTIGNTGIDPTEKGIVLHYRAMGDSKEVPGIYLRGSSNGRTLTHEVGHFFELLHIWGDDEGKCPGTGGSDDGISDTPPQAYPSYGCFGEITYDACTKVGDGIMYMNYMDYSDDSCLLMFTHEQVARMRQSVQPGANEYSLTQQEHLLLKPDPNNPIAANNFIVYPNPSDNVLNIRFKKQAEGLNSIYITDMAGRVVAVEEYEKQSSFYSFITSGWHAGMYFVVFDFDSGKEVQKVLVR